MLIEQTRLLQVGILLWDLGLVGGILNHAAPQNKETLEEITAERLEEFSAENFCRTKKHVSVGGVISLGEEIFLFFVLWITGFYLTVSLLNRLITIETTDYTGLTDLGVVCNV